jgi:5-(carboxyamino)imidazole ribonucleotide mutase
MAKVAIIMGSGSDRPVMEKAATMLDRFGVESDVRVISAHKSVEETLAFGRGARADGFDVIIAGAGKAAALPGLLAALTLVPVIGVPISATLDGMDALLSIVQMPTGIPVATVAIDAANNAALLAVQMIAMTDEDLRGKLADYREELRKTTLAG